MCSYSNTNCPDILQQWPEHSFCLPGNECNEVQVTEELCKFMSSENDRAETRTPVPRLQDPYSSIVEQLPLPGPLLVALHLGSLASVLFTSSMLSSLNSYFSSTLDSRPPPAPFTCYLSSQPLCFFNFCFFFSKTITFCEIGCEIFQMILPHSFSFFLKNKKGCENPCQNACWTHHENFFL